MSLNAWSTIARAYYWLSNGLHLMYSVDRLCFVCNFPSILRIARNSTFSNAVYFSNKLVF